MRETVSFPNKASDSPELDAFDKLAKATLEISALHRELEIKSDIIERQKITVDTQRTKIDDLQACLEQRTQDRIAVTADMTRQYKTIQSQLVDKVNDLQRESLDYKMRLVQLQGHFAETGRMHEAKLKEREKVIDDQKLKMAYMTQEFEGMLNVTMTRITTKLDKVTQKWSGTDQSMISESNLRRLEDFNLTRIGLGG